MTLSNGVCFPVAFNRITFYTKYHKHSQCAMSKQALLKNLDGLTPRQVTLSHFPFSTFFFCLTVLCAVVFQSSKGAHAKNETDALETCC